MALNYSSLTQRDNQKEKPRDVVRRGYSIPEKKGSNLLTSKNFEAISSAIGGSLKNYGKNVVGGAKILVGAGDEKRATAKELKSATLDTFLGKKRNEGELGGALGLARETISSPLRFSTRVGLTGIEALTGNKQDIELPSWMKGVYGIEQDKKGIESFQQLLPEQSKKLEELGASKTESAILPTLGVVGSAWADFTGTGGQVKKGLSGALTDLAKESSETAIKSKLITLFPDIEKSLQLDSLSKIVARQNKPNDIYKTVNSFIDDSRSKRVYSPEEIGQSIKKQESSVPPPKKNETRVYYYTTGKDGKQWVTNDINAVLREAPTVEGVPSKPYTIANVPTKTLNLERVDPVSGANIYTMPANIADDFNTQRILKEFSGDNIQKPPTPAKPPSVQRLLGQKPPKLVTIKRRPDVLLREKLQTAQTISKRAAVATRNSVKEIQSELVNLVSDLPMKERGKFIATIKNIQTPSQLKTAMPDVMKRVSDALEKASKIEQQKLLRKQVRDIIKQKKLKNTESLRKALALPKLNNMTVDELRSFARELAPYKPNDRFLSQRVLETIDRTSLAGKKTYREVQAQLAKEAGVPVEKLQSIKTSWYDKFLYDTALARQNPFYDVMVNKINASLIEGNIRFAKFEEALDEMLIAARNSRKKTFAGLRLPSLVPTDDAIFKYIESPDKDSLVNTLTPEELRVANFLTERYEDAYNYLKNEKMLERGIEDYVTHIRRSGLEAFKKDGLIAAIKETFEQYRLDKASFNILNEKTGDVLPLEKFFAFAQKRTGELKPSENIGRASKAYFMAFERKRALDTMVPELQAYTQSITPTIKTQKGLDFDPSIKTFFKTYLNNKRGRPATFIFNPGTPPDVIMRAVVGVTRLIDLGLSVPSFVAANMGEQASTFISQGTSVYARGIKRMNTEQGKAIVKQYRGFTGRSPWSEIRDTSKNFPDKLMTTMLSGFHDASVRANKQALLGLLSPEEYRTGVISPERLAELKNTAGRWRALDNSSSIVGSSSEGGIAKQYKAWAVPILMTTVSNLNSILKQTSKGVNPLTTREGKELMRETMVVGTVALVVYSYMNEEDDSFAGQVIQKSLRDALSAVGALNPELWLSTPRAWQYLQDVYAALESLVLMEKYKSGESAGTLKGDNALGRLITPAPIRQIGRDSQNDDGGSDMLGNIDLDMDLDLNLNDDIDIGDIDIGDIGI